MKTLSIALLAFSVVCTPASEAQERKAPVPELKRGGYVILFRHGETDRSLLPREQRKPEPAPMDLANCEIQAKLTANGREDARVIGEGFRALGIPVGQVLASGYCRTLETARLAFGRAEASDILLHPAYVPASGTPIPPAYSQRREALRQFLATPPPSGTNTVLVSHGEIFMDLIGSEGATGEGLIYKSDGQGGFTLVGRVLPTAWLAQPSTVGMARPGSPASAGDIRGGVWGGAKPTEGLEISTAELMQVLKSGAAVLDVRSVKECAIAHIPGSVCVPGVLRSDGTYGDHIEQIAQMYTDRATAIVLYCNGPYCGKSRRTAQSLAQKGYSNIRRYQLGLPVWRALGNTVQTDLAGLAYILKDDRTAVFVDARAPDKFKVETIPGSVNVRPGEATVANEDGRLPQSDKGTRIVIFGDSVEQARTVATEVARNAYWNSSYFGGTYEDIRRAKLW